MTTRMPARLLAVAAGLLALAGCDRSAPEQPVTVTDTVVESNVEEAPNMAVPAETPSPVTANAAEAAQREDPPAHDVQTQDDADATGMTSRVNRGEAPANETAP